MRAVKKRRGAEGEIDGRREEVVPTEAATDDDPPKPKPQNHKSVKFKNIMHIEPPINSCF